MSQMITISSIVIADRARKELGDLAELMASIETVGLLQPPVITTDHKLIAGHRRIEACKRLGRLAIPVIIAEDLTDAIDLLRAERDENTCRKPMLPSELVALGRRIEAVERPKAKAAQVSGAQVGAALTNGAHSPFVPQNKRRDEHVDTRRSTAAAVGMSAGTYHRVKEVANAAEGFHESFGKRTPVEPALQADAQAALDLMDRVSSGEEIRPSFDERPLTVTGIYNDWKDKAVKAQASRPKTDRSSATTPEPAPQPHPEVDPHRDKNGRRIPPRAQRKAIADGIAALSGLCAGFTSVDQIDESVSAEEAGQWAADLSTSLRALRSLHNKLKEHANGIG